MKLLAVTVLFFLSIFVKSINCADCDKTVRSCNTVLKSSIADESIPALLSKAQMLKATPREALLTKACEGMPSIEACFNETRAACGSRSRKAKKFNPEMLKFFCYPNGTVKPNTGGFSATSCDKSAVGKQFLKRMTGFMRRNMECLSDKPPPRAPGEAISEAQKQHESKTECRSQSSAQNQVCHLFQQFPDNPCSADDKRELFRTMLPPISEDAKERCPPPPPQDPEKFCKKPNRRGKKRISLCLYGCGHATFYNETDVTTCQFNTEKTQQLLETPKITITADFKDVLPGKNCTIATNMSVVLRDTKGKEKMRLPFENNKQHVLNGESKKVAKGKDSDEGEVEGEINAKFTNKDECEVVDTNSGMLLKMYRYLINTTVPSWHLCIRVPESLLETASGLFVEGCMSYYTISDSSPARRRKRSTTATDTSAEANYDADQMGDKDAVTISQTTSSYVSTMEKEDKTFNSGGRNGPSRISALVFVAGSLLISRLI